MDDVIKYFLLGFLLMLPASVYIYVSGAIKFDDWFWPFKE